MKVLNKKIFEELFRTHYKPLCAFANKYLKDIDSAKEIVHDVFVRLWEKRDSIDLEKAIKTYLYTSVNNRSLNYIRDNKKFVRDDFLLENTYNNDNWKETDKLIELDIQEKINATLDALPKKCQKVFRLSRYEDMKYKEIAEHLNISIKTVETHISKALKVLRENLSEYLTYLLIIYANTL